MLTPKQIDTFVDNLKNAYSIASHLITEDSIRHFFIEALVANGISINDIAIEVPYVVNPGTKTKGKRNYTPIKVLNSKWFNSERNRADIYYFSTKLPVGFDLSNPRPVAADDMVIEVKYHRATPYSDSCTTSKAGEVFNDLNRLSMIDAKNKYFVYVFDDGMYNTYNGYKINYNATILKTTFNIGDIAVIDNNYPITPTSKKVKNFKENAFKTFQSAYTDFKYFDYDVQCAYNAPIVQGKLWCIILKVDRNKKA